ncbi:MAG: Rossmann-like and DUF2520 domain-containing protein [Muribaculaceae bacterium]
MERITKNTRTVIIGAGNVATHMAKALRMRLNIIQIFSHDIENAHILANSIDCTCFTSSIDDISKDADIYIIAIKDDAIESLISKISNFTHSSLWVHTSGSKPMTVFEGKMNNYGVFYPLQTFSKNVEVNFQEIPIFVEANDTKNIEQIKELAHLLSPKVYDADSDRRRQLHIAAVFACNFANHLWTISDELLRDTNLPFSILMPLIRASVNKLDKVSPAQSQTGPAVRNDTKVIEKHLSMLSDNKKEIYKTLTNSIIDSANKTNL